MKNTIFASVFALLSAGSVAAQNVSGGVGIELTENAAGDYVAETTLDLGFAATTDAALAFGSSDVTSFDGSNLAIDGWQLGTTIAGATVSVGDQGDLFVENDFEIVGGETLANPAEHDSVIVKAGNVAALVGFTDVTTDVTDVANVQLSYAFDVATVGVTAVVDYDNAIDDVTLGGKASLALNDKVNVGGIVTYANATDSIGYEANASYGIVTAFVNGDDVDAFQNVGAGVNTKFNNLNVYAEGSYNLDAKDGTVGAGVAFKF